MGFLDVVPLALRRFLLGLCCKMVGLKGSEIFRILWQKKFYNLNLDTCHAKPMWLHKSREPCWKADDLKFTGAPFGVVVAGRSGIATCHSLWHPTNQLLSWSPSRQRLWLPDGFLGWNFLKNLEGQPVGSQMHSKGFKQQTMLSDLCHPWLK